MAALKSLTELIRLSPTLITTKLSPQTIITIRAKNKSLFDNLDKSWSTIGVDRTDAVTLRCLIDAGRKVERDMQRRGHEFRCIVFVRDDVYQHLMANSSDYGKEMRATLDWSDPDLLRELLRLRLISNLGQEFKDASFKDMSIIHNA